MSRKTRPSFETSPAPAQKLRCAIYTRKSTEEGLDQEYNSLDAQRDAGVAYITSQRHEGWELITDTYDDGGFSGGNIERPALKRLLDDIRAGKIDIVVVYKVDRISRSLTDFANIIQIFDQHNVSFVSVTQNFNTTSSMGRLTLNILLSFAQFEREVIGERIRDKFAASRRKGIFMGGAVPLGYRAENRKRHIIPEEAGLVRHIYKRYIEKPSITQLLKELNDAGHRTKHYISGTGKERGGNLFDKQYVYHILRNPLYIGKAVHKGNVYDGQHEAIIDQDSFDKVQVIFAENISQRTSRRNLMRNKNPALLRGLVRCTCCNSVLTPTFVRRKSKIYWYYTATVVNRRSYDDCVIGSVPDGEIEPLVVAYIRQVIQSPETITGTHGKLVDEDDFALEDIREQFSDFDGFWATLQPVEQQRIVELLVRGITINSDEVKIELRLEGFRTLLRKYGKEDEHALSA